MAMKSVGLLALVLLGCTPPPSASAIDASAGPVSSPPSERANPATGPSASPAVSAPGRRVALPDAGGERYLALGDSFTVGTGTTLDRSFPARLAARWQAAGCHATVKNLGVNGYTTDDLIDAELPEVHGFAPTWVTLAVGANDIVHGRAEADYRSRLKRIFAALVENGVTPAHVLVLPQPEWSSSPTAAGFGDTAALGAKIVLFNQILRDEAALVGARWVDLTARMHTEAGAHMIASDGLHPSAAAYDEWAADLAALGLPCRM